MSIDEEPELDPVLMGYIPPQYAHMIKADPHRSGPARARLVGFERPIWGIILDIVMFGGVADVLDASEEVIQQTADGFGVSVEAVHASLAYYELNRFAIDAKIQLDSTAARGGRSLSR